MQRQNSVSFAVVGAGVAFALLVPMARASAAELFAYWALEETDAAAAAADSGPSGLAGTLLPGVNPDVDGAPGFGSGAEFDGTVNGSIDLGANSPLGELLSDFSIVAWIFPTALTGKNRIIGSLQPNGWGFGPRNNNQLEVTTFDVKDYRASVDLLQEEWTHVAVVLDANADATFYVNGIMISTDPAGGPARLSFDNFYIGRAASSAEYFTGRLDEVAVFDGSLTEDDIIDIMEDGVLPEVGPTEPEFRRGDAANDGTVNISSAIFILSFLFTDTVDSLPCMEAGDINNDGLVNLTDPVNLLNHLFGTAAPPEPPGLTDCGPDPDQPDSPGDLGCEEYTTC